MTHKLVIVLKPSHIMPKKTWQLNGKISEAGSQLTTSTYNWQIRKKCPTPNFRIPPRRETTPMRNSLMQRSHRTLRAPSPEPAIRSRIRESPSYNQRTSCLYTDFHETFTVFLVLSIGQSICSLKLFKSSKPDESAPCSSLRDRCQSWYFEFIRQLYNLSAVWHFTTSSTFQPPPTFLNKYRLTRFLSYSLTPRV